MSDSEARVFALAPRPRAKASSAGFRGMSLTKFRATHFRFQARTRL